MNYKIVVWGLGSVYNKHLNLLKYYEFNAQFQVVALTATKIPRYDIIDEYPVIKADSLFEIAFDYIIVMNDKNYKEIMNEAINQGIPKEKILPYRILEIPFLKFDEYIRLKESNISIISNNCWGGMVYYTLGIECCSPFKNLFLEDSDYIKLLENIYDYLSLDLKFLRYDIDMHSHKKYTVMELGDVLFHCNHDSEPEFAIKSWKRRREKINYNNLFIEMYTVNEKVADRFLELKQYSKKICFTPFKKKSKEIIQLSLYPGQKEFYEVVNSTAGIGSNSLDYRILDLLNGRVVYRKDL